MRRYRGAYSISASLLIDEAASVCTVDNPFRVTLLIISSVIYLFISVSSFANLYKEVLVCWKTRCLNNYIWNINHVRDNTHARC